MSHQQLCSYFSYPINSRAIKIVLSPLTYPSALDNACFGAMLINMCTWVCLNAVNVIIRIPTPGSDAAKGGGMRVSVTRASRRVAEDINRTNLDPCLRGRISSPTPLFFSLNKFQRGFFAPASDSSVGDLARLIRSG